MYKRRLQDIHNVQKTSSKHSQSTEDVFQTFITLKRHHTKEVYQMFITYKDVHNVQRLLKDIYDVQKTSFRHSQRTQRYR